MCVFVTCLGQISHPTTNLDWSLPLGLGYLQRNTPLCTRANVHTVQLHLSIIANSFFSEAPVATDKLHKQHTQTTVQHYTAACSLCLHRSCASSAQNFFLVLLLVQLVSKANTGQLQCSMMRCFQHFKF